MNELYETQVHAPRKQLDKSLNVYFFFGHLRSADKRGFEFLDCGTLALCVFSVGRRVAQSISHLASLILGS